jgi:FKBP-type peptidyl-prolyl cis-trans isomerase
MRRAVVVAVAGLCGLYLSCGAADPPAAPPPSGPGATGYGVGFVLGGQVREGARRDGVLVDPVLVAQGFADGLRGAAPTMPRDEFERVLQAVHTEMQARMVKRLMEENPKYKEAYDRNLALSTRFHGAFAKQPGVITLPSGVQYKVLRTGTGRAARGAAEVVVDAEVKLLDGTTVLEGNGMAVRIEGALPGAAEFLGLMRGGDRWQVAIPPDRAFGAAGRAPNIGPNETLVGIVELLAVKEGA